MNAVPKTNTGSMTEFYRVAYRVKADGSIVRLPAYHLLEDAKKVVKAFNARYQEDYEYFVEQTSVGSIPEDYLLKLTREGKLAVEESSPYLNSITLKRYLTEKVQ